MQTRALAPALLAVLVLGGCTSGSDVSSVEPVGQQEAGSSPPSTEREPPSSAANAEDAVGGIVSAVDVTFIQDMIAHHEQAVQMTEMVETRTGHDELRWFAKQMGLVQASEIELMQGWLDDRDAQAADSSHAHDHGADEMSGMISDEDLTALAAADGSTFDRLFLELMIHHHQGALEMVEQLYADGGARSSGLSRFAKHLVDDQEIEIGRMKAMLRDLAAAS